MARAEVVVVGAGIVGLATAVALADAGVDVRCFERAEPGVAGSAGLTRIFRHVHGTAGMVALAVRSRAGWAEWERRARRRLVGDEGLLVLYNAKEPDEALTLLADAGVAARLVDAEGQAEALPRCARERPGPSSTRVGAIRIRRAASSWRPGSGRAWCARRSSASTRMGTRRSCTRPRTSGAAGGWSSAPAPGRRSWRAPSGSTSRYP